MERRDFLKIAAGVAIGATALATQALAAPIPPKTIDHLAGPEPKGAEPAVVSGDEVAQMAPEQVRWHRFGRRRRFFGFRRRHFYGFRRRRFWHRRRY